MRNSQEVIGLWIVHLPKGKRLGKVSDLLFDADQQLRGMLIETSGLLRRRKFLPADRICSIGKDAVIVDNETAILPLDEVAEQWISVLSGHKRLKGRSVLLSTGYEVGTIENVYFLEEMGTLIGYEISDGLLNDLQNGRKWLKSAQPLIWGEDVLIASADQVQLQDAR